MFKRRKTREEGVGGRLVVGERCRRDSLPAVIEVPGYALRQVEPQCVEVDLAKCQDLAPIFTALSGAGVTVVSMRNKENRLERMFVNVLEGAS